MRIEGRLEPADIQQQLRALQARAPSDTGAGANLNLTARPALSLTVLVGATIALGVGYLWLQSRGASAILLAVILACAVTVAILAVLVGVAAWMWAYARRKLLAQPGTLGHRIHVIEPEGLRTETTAANSLLRWSAISDVRADEHYIFVYIGRTSGPIIPRRFFASRAEADAFLQALRQHVADAGGGPGAPEPDLPRAVARERRDES